jgi:hypothetical protein
MSGTRTILLLTAQEGGLWTDPIAGEIGHGSTAAPPGSLRRRVPDRHFRRHWLPGAPPKVAPFYPGANIRLARAAVPARIRHFDTTEYGADDCAAAILAGISAMAVWTHTPLLQMLVHLLRNYDILHAGQQRLPLAQAQTQRFHRQFPSLDCKHLPSLFGAVRVYAYYLDPDTHD